MMAGAIEVRRPGYEAITAYRDGFGNWCTRIVAPQGRIRVATTGVVRDTGEPDEIAASASQHPVQDLPDETLGFLLGSRYSNTDRLSQVASDLFEKFQTDPLPA
jgi:transglutaminase-like putative cysteine protease